AKPREYGVASAGRRVTRFGLGQTEPEHGDPELLRHPVVAEDVLLQLSVELEPEFGLRITVELCQSVKRERFPRRRKLKAELRYLAADERVGSRRPVDLPRDLVEELVDHVHLRRGCVDRGDEEA